MPSPSRSVTVGGALKTTGRNAETRFALQAPKIIGPRFADSVRHGDTLLGAHRVRPSIGPSRMTATFATLLARYARTGVLRSPPQVRVVYRDGSPCHDEGPVGVRCCGGELMAIN